ncbi:hypothetical protein [Paenibacillus sp. YIM B09110]|uniref:hypothetical protein n=1 Tax=Paenibacillus sp. YIM B09110 TaxID=3126102 RepID=UPI00301C21D6
MKATLTKADLESPQLSWKCIEPMLLSVRAKDLATKAAVYNELNEGQRALFLFYAFHNHVHSVAEFYWFTAYSMIELRSWDGLKNGLRYFNNDDLAGLLERIEHLIKNMNKTGEQGRMVSPTDVEEDKVLFQSVEELYVEYNSAAPKAIAKMNEIILNNTVDYIELEND